MILKFIIGISGLLMTINCSDSGAVTNAQKASGVEVSRISAESIDFKATGNEPSWVLEMDFDGKMHFKSLSYPDEIVADVPKPEIAQDHPVERYAVNTKQGQLVVSIHPDTCMDTMSGEKFPFRVNVEVRPSEKEEFQRFKGCGRHLLDEKLHNIWALVEMEGITVNAEDFGNGVPTLEIFASTGRLAGHDGCNRLFGKITGNHVNLKLGMLGSTMMACPKMETSQKFVKLISDQQFQYEFEPGLLLLKQDGAVVLKFKNVD